MKKILFILGLCILISVGFFFVFHKDLSSYQSVVKNNSIVIPVHTLSSQSFTYTKNFIGSVQAIQSVDIVPYLSGFLKEVRVHSGQEVQEGQTLFLLDERIPFADLNQAKEAVSQAYATRSNAAIFYERMKNTESKAISPTELEQAKTEFEAADAAYQKALAAQNQAQTLYDYTIIQAPISGWVGNITATVGEYLSPESKTLATLIGFSPIRLAFAVPMATYHLEKPLTHAVLQVVLAGDKTVEFRDFKVMRDNRTDPTTDSLAFFVDVPNPHKNFFPGAYVEIRFLFDETGILVDKNWITLTPDGAEAFVLTNGVVEKRSVQIGAPVGHQYWIKEGLNEGEDIITVPVSAHQVGQKAQGVRL